MFGKGSGDCRTGSGACRSGNFSGRLAHLYRRRRGPVDNTRPGGNAPGVPRIDGQSACGRCPTDSPQVQISIREEAPRGLDGVLGLSHHNRERIEPRLELFYDGLVRYIGDPNNVAAIGRALARVAGHEASHFLEQQAHHCMFGLMRAALPAYALTSKDSWRGHRQSRCQIGQARATEGGVPVDLQPQRGSNVSRQRSVEEPGESVIR